MGDVYLAEDTKLGRKVALKVLPAELAESEQRRVRFAHKAKALAALNHPNIVTVYSVEEASSVHFITMELVRGNFTTATGPRTGSTPWSIARKGTWEPRATGTDGSDKSCPKGYRRTKSEGDSGGARVRNRRVNLRAVSGRCGPPSGVTAGGELARDRCQSLVPRPERALRQ